ncbi:unnamed protein product [Chrysodeixis includens]|uniref:Chitin-binding type-2 domain-containing protein n=1 Tax=Chrysodeixis includens TaxID=689277 RepID=A0A9N8KRW2_CHRIL|nr:unnamed protein product [Chrysodeixis includens]
MEKQAIIAVVLLSVCVWQVYAVVNCTATGSGRFADPADATCQNYTRCIYNAANTSYVSYNYVCPTTSLFSPTLSQCTSTYTCPNTTNTATTATCTADGFIADPSSTTCSSYIQCVQVNGAFIQTQLPCPTGTFYNPTSTLLQLHMSYNFCIQSLDQTLYINLYLPHSNWLLSVCSWQVSAVVNCTATGAGRFADPADATCQNYTLCIYNTATTSYVSYNYVCPTTSLFSPTLSQCTSTYTCPNTTTATTTNNATCTADGFVADPSSTDCSTYIQCVLINGVYSQTQLTCPTGTYYNPTTTLCESTYVLCVCTWQAHAAVNCATTGAGRHPDLADPTCKNYTLCIYVKTSNSYLSYNTVCPSVTLFDPKISRCTSPNNFKCQVSVPPKSVCTAEGFIPDPNSSNCSSYIECIDINGTFGEWKYDCPKNTYFNPNSSFCEPDYNCSSAKGFTCAKAGRVADETDNTCKRYYYCVALATGLFTQYNYTCPSTSLFNPNTKLCTSKYQCV